MTGPKAQIDHIVLLLSYADLQSPPPWITNHFTVTPGGVHADGRTENKLIVFQDGTYIELIAFINDDPTRKAGHIWGNKETGLIDFALTSPATPGGDSAARDYAALRARIWGTDHRSPRTLGIDYFEPIEGGRTRPDGTQVRWKVTLPTYIHTGHRHRGHSPTGSVPFLCHDVTPRSLRVDPTSIISTTHPSAVKGIAQFTIIVPPSQLEEYIDMYAVILNTRPVRAMGTTRLELEAPVKVPGLVNPWVFIEPPGFDLEQQRLSRRGVEIVEVAFREGREGGQAGVVRESIEEKGVWIHFLR